MPPVVRSVVGVLFMIGGVLGFLPILGFWMIPLGAAFIALDIPPMRARIHRWMEKLHAKAYPGEHYEIPSEEVPQKGAPNDEAP